MGRRANYPKGDPPRVFIPGVGVVAVALAVLAAPAGAWAQGSSSGTAVLPLPADLWVSAAAGGGAAVIVVVLGAVVAGVRPGSLRAPVREAPAWDFKDSWVTNLTALGTVLTGVFTQSAISSFVPNVNKDGFTIMSLLFGGAALMGPVVYGAFASKTSVPAAPAPAGVPPPARAPAGSAPAGGPSASKGPAGTRAGLLLTDLVTLFATYGLLADIGLLVSNSVATRLDQVLVDIGLALSGLVVAVYAIRSTKVMVEVPAAAARSTSLLSARLAGTL